MQAMKRNQRPVWYARMIGTNHVLDDDGNKTSELYPTWTEPVKLNCNVSGGKGSWMEEASFGGTFTNYDRTISLTGKCVLEVGDRLWVGREPSERFNYMVVGVNQGLTEHLIAIKEVPTGA